MYDIFIKNFYRNGVLVKDEVRLYSIPIQEGNQDNVLTDPIVSTEVGKTGSFEFTVYPNHPYYHALAQMRTIMRVDYDGETIFRGRILTIDNTLTGIKKIHCEGDMAFLLDSFQMGTKKENWPKMKLGDYIEEILENHNQQMSEAGETDKCIYPGYIPGAYPDEFTSEQIIENVTQAFGSSSHEQSMNALETLAKEFGGIFRTYYSIEDRKTYLDWCRCWFRKEPDSYPIAITQNIIDANSNSEVDNIFTAVIPVGKSDDGDEIFINGYRTDIHGNNNRILVPQITKVYSEADLNRGYVNKSIYEKAVDQYGIIYKVQNFSNADTQEKLWSYACDWIKNNYVGGITDYDLSAVDMHHVDGKLEKYLAGDCIPIILPSDMTELDEYNPDKRSSTVYRTILSIKYDLHHPDKNSYSAGIPSDILTYEYGTSSTSKSKSSGGGGGKKGGASGKAGPKTPKGDGDDQETQERLEALDSLAYQFVIDASHNSTEYRALNAKNPERAAAAQKASKIVVKKTLEDPNFGKAEITSLVVDGKKGKIGIMPPLAAEIMLPELYSSGLLQNPGFMNMIDGCEEFVETANALTFSASDKSIAFRGNNSPTMEAITDKLVEMKQNGIITGNETPEEIVAIVEDITGQVVDPNIVAEISVTVDEQGKEAGKVDLAKEDVKNVTMNAGGNDGRGSAVIGRETKSGGKWLIKMNEPLQYKDSEGVTHTVPNGTIDASDYAILSKGGQSIPSVFAQIGVFDTLIAENARLIKLKADNAEFGTVKAEVANLKKVTADIVSANYVTTKDLNTATIRLCNRNVTPKLFSQLSMGSWVLAVT